METDLILVTLAYMYRTMIRAFSVDWFCKAVCSYGACLPTFTLGIDLPLPSLTS